VALGNRRGAGEGERQAIMGRFAISAARAVSFMERF
jgi:hypothetical protein